jgi:hypothetical protein
MKELLRKSHDSITENYFFLGRKSSKYWRTRKTGMGKGWSSR